MTKNDEYKPHVTVTITSEMLDKAYACTGGKNAVAHLLPAKISTDPEQNIALACELADNERSDRSCDAYWLALVANRMIDGASDSCSSVIDSDNPNVPCGRDAWVIAQHLAMAADTIATAKGR